MLDVILFAVGVIVLAHEYPYLRGAVINFFAKEKAAVVAEIPKVEAEVKSAL